MYRKLGSLKLQLSYFDLEEALAISDQIAVMCQGKLEQRSKREIGEIE